MNYLRFSRISVSTGWACRCSSFLCMSMHSVFSFMCIFPGRQCLKKLIIFYFGTAWRLVVLWILLSWENETGPCRQWQGKTLFSIILSFLPSPVIITFFCYSVFLSIHHLKKSRDVPVQELLASNGEASSVLSDNVEKRIYLACTLNNSKCSFSFIDIPTYAIKSC